MREGSSLWPPSRHFRDLGSLLIYIKGCPRPVALVRSPIVRLWTLHLNAQLSVVLWLRLMLWKTATSVLTRPDPFILPRLTSVRSWTIPGVELGGVFGVGINRAVKLTVILCRPWNRGTVRRCNRTARFRLSWWRVPYVFLLVWVW